MNAVLAGLGICLLTPVILLIAVAIRLESEGFPLYRQKRIGRHLKPFALYKLRTMRLGTPEAATHMVPADRITKLGAMLRRTRLDELPQLWNVLVGDMDFVGPRPCLPSQSEVIAARERAGVFAIRPGITGLAQVRGQDMSDPEALARSDREYVETASLRQDLAILSRTASALLGR